MTTHTDDHLARGERRTRSLLWLPVLLVALAIPAGSVQAVCASSGSIYHGFTSSFEQCGPSAAAFAWFHGRAVQRSIGPLATSENTVSGHDSGRNQTQADYMMIDGPNGAANGSYFGSTGFYNFGFDGCITNIPENPLGCAGIPDFGVLDYVIGGVDPSSPDVARMALVSVDFNEPLTGYLLDNAGALSVDGDPCGSDAFSTLSIPVNCAPIPQPVIVATTPDDSGIDVTVGIGDVSGIPMLDDCTIAETRATNCPRNLYAGRVLVYKRGTCAAGEVATFDRRAYIYPTGSLYYYTSTTVDANWRMLSPEDQDYDEVLDPGEDGSNGGTVNGKLDRVILAGTSPLNTLVRVSRIDDGLECLYLGLAIGLDANALSVNPPTNSIFGEMVLSPVVSVNPNAISLAPAPPESDLITSLQATRSGGQVTVAWSTTNERMTAGFDVFGSKRSGKEVHLNSSQIPAQEGTTGEGASYTMSFDIDLMKGGSLISVDLVLMDGSRKRFGPVPILTVRQITGG